MDSSLWTLPTPPGVRRELVCDQAIQERIDLVCDGSDGTLASKPISMIHSQNMPTSSVPIILSRQ